MFLSLWEGKRNCGNKPPADRCQHPDHTSSINPSVLHPISLVSAVLEISHFVLHGGHDVLEPYSQLFTLGGRVLVQGSNNLKGREEKEERIRRENDGLQKKKKPAGTERCYLTSVLASQGLLLFASAT